MIEQPSTPALLVDQGTFERNVDQAERLVAPSGKQMRVHVKTHRTPDLALMQLGGHAVGVTCATVGEMEAMAAAGIDDLLLANEIVSPDKLERVARLAGMRRVLITVDSARGVNLLADAVRGAGSKLGVLIDVDVGLNRCGVRSADDAVALAQHIGGARGLELAGLMGYEGRLRASVGDRTQRFDSGCRSLQEAKTALEQAGFDVAIVSGAGTSTFIDALASPVLTEIQAGTYVLMESDLDGLGLPFERACTVLATVISTWSSGAVLDAGRKSVGCENGLPEVALSDATVYKTNEEHTILHMDRPPPLGSRVKLFPSKVPTTFNLHDRVWLVRGETIERSLPITARGRSD